MFMLICRKGVVSSTQVVAPPINPRRRTRRHRTRDQWRFEMAAKAARMDCDHFAFRYMGRWWLCARDLSVEPTPVSGDARAGAEMWLIHQEARH